MTAAGHRRGSGVGPQKASRTGSARRLPSEVTHGEAPQEEPSEHSHRRCRRGGRGRAVRRRGLCELEGQRRAPVVRRREAGDQASAQRRRPVLQLERGRAQHTHGGSIEHPRTLREHAEGHLAVDSREDHRSPAQDRRTAATPKTPVSPPPPHPPHRGARRAHRRPPPRRPRPALLRPETSHACVELVNAERAKVGCSPLTVNAKLTKAAQAHSEDMAAHANMSHTGSDGSAPGDRITRAGYDWSSYGENVAYGYATPRRSWPAGCPARVTRPTSSTAGSRRSASVSRSPTTTGPRTWSSPVGRLGPRPWLAARSGGHA